MEKEALQIAIGERIKELRNSKGWSQAEFARHCEKDRQTIEKLENGKVNATLYTYYELAKALGVTVSKLTKDIEK